MNVHMNAGISYSQATIQAALAKSGTTAGQQFEIKVEVSEVQTADSPRTIDDVKREFYEYLDSLPISPGLSRTPISVNVTEAAFEKMLADPEYEQKMKDLCKRDLCDPAWSKLSPTGIAVTIDADCEEEYLATSWSSPDGHKNVDEDGFWTRRAKKRKAAREVEEKAAQERSGMLQFLQERADARKRLSKESFATDSEGRGIAAYVSRFESARTEIYS